MLTLWQVLSGITLARGQDILIRGQDNLIRGQDDLIRSHDNIVRGQDKLVQMVQKVWLFNHLTMQIGHLNSCGNSASADTPRRHLRIPEETSLR